MKTCCTCKSEKPFGQFNKNRSTKDGYQKQCNDCRLLAQQKYRNESTGKDTLKRYHSSDKGRERVRENTKKYRQTKKYVESWKKTSKKNRLHQTISTRMRQSLNGCKYNRKWESLVNYTLEGLKQHLELQFQEGMDWSNHGLYGWHIDHVRPIDSFDIESYDDDDFKECWSLSNLQPLWWQDNLRKSNNYET